MRPLVQYFLFSLVILASVFSASCSNGGRSAIPGNQCSDDYQPIKTSVDAAHKVSLSPDAGGHLNLKPGEYNYTGADFYFEDAPVANNKNYRVHVKDAWDDKQKSFKPSVACVRNAKAAVRTKNLAVATKGVSALKIDDDRKLNLEGLNVRTYGFKIEDNGAMTLNMSSTSDRPTDPAAVHKDGFIFVHPENPDIIELRSEGKSESGGRWKLANKFHRVNAN